ncbi:DUF6056 family protein [Streptomyces sp. NPDC051018]|uniref:DUF6056 family protein n=1 Tax=Streptomyces sp. NPDC051018 TaxID=3365639 RepID=UPI0037A05B5E
MPAEMTACHISVVVPCRDDSGALDAFHGELLDSLVSTHHSFEICYVDDGSRDRTRERLAALTADRRVRYTSFSRRFGTEAAVLAGLRMARGDAVFLLEAGPRCRPGTVLPRILDLRGRGYDQVVARPGRTGGRGLRAVLGTASHRALRHCMDVDIAEGPVDVRLLSRRAVDSVLSLPEGDRYSRGIFSWIGFDTASLACEVTGRTGEPPGHRSVRTVLDRGLDGVISFNSRPLRLAVHAGLLLFLGALGYALWVVLHAVLHGAAVPGYTSLLVTVVALGGIQLALLGVVGEYVGRIHHEAKRRPHYVVRETDDSRPAVQRAGLPADMPPDAPDPGAGAVTGAAEDPSASRATGAGTATGTTSGTAGPRSLRQFLLFAVVGVVNTAVYLAVYASLNTRVPYLLAHAVGYTVSVVGSFLLNSYVTCRTRPTWRSFARYPLSSVAGLVAGGGLLALGVGVLGMDKNIAALSAGILVTPLSFLIARWAIVSGSAAPRPRAVGDDAPAGRPAVWTVTLCLLPLGLLAAAAWFGQYVRPGADDWCFLPAARDDGVSGMIAKFYLQDNGRVANALLVGLYARFGVAGHQWFAPVTALVTLGVLWTVTALGLRRAGLRTPRGIPLLVAAMLTAVFLFATPNTYKTLYWPASSVSHTLAPVLACAATIPLLLTTTRTGRAAALTTAFAAGCFLGTLSEQASIVALVVVSCVLLLSGVIFTGRVRPYARWWCLTGGAGVLTGTLVLFTSPGSQNRRQRYGADTSLLSPEVLITSLDSFRHILITLLTTWQYAGAVAAGLLLGLLSRGTGTRPSPVALSRRRLLAGAGAVSFLVSGYLCCVAAYPVFGKGVATVSRAWNDYLLLYVVLLVGAGTLLGRLLRPYSRRAGTARVTGAAVCAVCCLAFAVSLGRLAQDMSARAQAWDHQDRWLRTQAAHGARVLPYKPLSVSGMGEPFGKHGSWPAGCVADWYHIDKVTRADRLP